jgi:hypothetical protein
MALVFIALKSPRTVGSGTFIWNHSFFFFFLLSACFSMRSAFYLLMSKVRCVSIPCVVHYALFSANKPVFLFTASLAEFSLVIDYPGSERRSPVRLIIGQKPETQRKQHKKFSYTTLDSLLRLFFGLNFLNWLCWKR